MSKTILHVAEAVTMRTLKMMIGLQALKMRGILFYNKTWHDQMMGFIINQSSYWSNEQLAGKLEAHVRLDSYDTVHVYTALDNVDFIKRVRQIVGDRARIIWDIHDIVDKKKARSYVQYADAITVPSEGFANIIRKVSKDKPVEVIYGMVPDMLFPQIRNANTKHINGTVLCSGIGIRERKQVWRDYREVQEKLCEPLFIFPGGNSDFDQIHYKNLFQVHQYDKMMHMLPAFNWGYAGAANSDHTINNCFTNKFWEYVAAGLPVLTFNAKEMAEFKGWHVRDLQKLDEKVYPVSKTTRAELWKDRNRYTMESQVDKFRRLYD